MKKIFLLVGVIISVVVLAGTDPANIFRLGNGAATNKRIIFNRGGSNPEIRWNNSTSKFQTSVDGSTFLDLLSAGTFGFNRVVLPFTGSATGDTTPVTGSAPTWTFTTPSTVTRLIACGRGGGGGGGGSNTATGGFGGGGSVTVCLPLAVTASTAYTITIGAGGTAGSSADGGDGSSTTFGVLATFRGAKGGKRGITSDPDVNTLATYFTESAYGVAGGGRGGYARASIIAAGAASVYALGGAAGSDGSGLGKGAGGGGGDGAGGNGSGATAGTAATAGTDGGGGGGGGATSEGKAGGNGSMTIIWIQ